MFLYIYMLSVIYLFLHIHMYIFILRLPGQVVARIPFLHDCIRLYFKSQLYISYTYCTIHDFHTLHNIYLCVYTLYIFITYFLYFLYPRRFCDCLRHSFKCLFICIPPFYLHFTRDTMHIYLLYINYILLYIPNNTSLSIYFPTLSLPLYTLTYTHTTSSALQKQQQHLIVA